MGCGHCGEKPHLELAVQLTLIMSLPVLKCSLIRMRFSSVQT